MNVYEINMDEVFKLPHKTFCFSANFPEWNPKRAPLMIIFPELMECEVGNFFYGVGPFRVCDLSQISTWKYAPSSSSISGIVTHGVKIEQCTHIQHLGRFTIQQKSIKY